MRPDAGADSLPAGLAGSRPLLAWAVAAVLAAGALARLGLDRTAVVGVPLAAVLGLLSVIDLEHRIVPNRIVLPAAGAALAGNAALFPDRAAEWAIASLGAAALFLAAALVYPAGLGMGDVKLVLLLGAALGYAVAAALTIGMLGAFVAGGALIARRGLAARKTTMPLVPFLAAGALATLLAGPT